MQRYRARKRAGYKQRTASAEDSCNSSCQIQQSSRKFSLSDVTVVGVLENLVPGRQIGAIGATIQESKTPIGFEPSLAEPSCAVEAYMLDVVEISLAVLGAQLAAISAVPEDAEHLIIVTRELATATETRDSTGFQCGCCKCDSSSQRV